MSGTAKRLAEAANQIVNPQPIAEAKQLGTVAPFNYNMELLKAMSADEDGKVKFAVSGFMLRVYGKGASSDLVNFFKKVLNDAGKQYKIVAQSRFDVQYVSPKDTSGIFQKGFEGITVNTGNIIASNKELLDRFGKSVYDAVRKQFPSNSVQVGGAYDGAISGGFNYGKGLGFSGVDLARSMSPKGSMMGEGVQIAEAFKNGDKVKVPHKGKMVSGRIIRYDDGGTSKAQQHGGGYVVDVGEPASIFVTKEKIQKEAVVTEISKATKDAYVAKRGSQLQRMTTGLDKDRNLLTGRQQANAVKGIKRATGVKAEEVVAEAEWKSLKKTKVDLNALRQQGYKISVQHGEGDTLYKITGKPSKPATAKKEAVEESVQQIDKVVRSLYTDELLDAIEKAYKKGGLRGVIKGDKQVSDTTVDEVLRDMKPLFGNDMEYAVKKIKRLLKPQDYAKYKTKMEGWGEEVEQIDELTKMRRLGQTVGAILSKNPEASTPAQRLNTAQSIRANKQYWTPERIAKQTEIDAKIRKANAGEAVAQIKQILDTYDKATREMILAGMKSIKESAEITEAPYTPANDYEGEMAMTQLKSIMEKASDVLGMMKPEAKMEAWVQSKITLADEHISCVRDYLKHTDGAIG